MKYIKNKKQDSLQSIKSDIGNVVQNEIKNEVIKKFDVEKNVVTIIQNHNNTKFKRRKIQILKHLQVMYKRIKKLKNNSNLRLLKNKEEI